MTENKEIASLVVELKGRKIEVYLIKIDYPSHYVIKPYARFIDNKPSSKPKVEFNKKNKTLSIGTKIIDEETIKTLRRVLDRIEKEEDEERKKEIEK